MYNCGIYQIRNLINGHLYIGQSINLSGRKSVHFSKLRNNKHYNIHLQNAFNLYGKDNFVFEILLFCEKTELTYYEQKLVDLWNPIYNIRLECVDSPKGSKHTKEVKEKISFANKGKRLGKKQTKESKEKIGLVHKGKKQSIETRGKMTATAKKNWEANKEEWYKEMVEKRKVSNQSEEEIVKFTDPSDIPDWWEEKYFYL
jgi:group I intron endonuclease